MEQRERLPSNTPQGYEEVESGVRTGSMASQTYRAKGVKVTDNDKWEAHYQQLKEQEYYYSELRRNGENGGI